MSIEYAQGWDDAKAQVTTDNSATLIEALNMVADQAQEISNLKAENASIRTLMDCYNLGGWTDSLGLITAQRSALAEQSLEIQRLKAELSDAEATVELSGADLERKDAALRVALAELERLDKDSPFPIGVKAIPIIKEAL
jgi:ABC-type transporter Mla MlaB component